MINSQTILKVNHAGEYGAIQIYNAQITVSKFFSRSCTPHLIAMRNHEIEHFRIFDALASSRKSPTCHALWLWAAGGYLLGTMTALFGPKGIWTCTISVESTVFEHLQSQIAWTKENDPELQEAVLSIIKDEMEHRDEAFLMRGPPRIIDKVLEKIVKFSTHFAIWLSHKL